MRRESRTARSALSRLTDVREVLKKAAANRVLPTPRWRVSRTRTRGRRKPPRIACCPLRAFASRGRARGVEESRRDSRVAHSALARLTDVREGLKGSELPTNCSQLARLADAHERLKKAAANRVLPAPRWRVSRTRTRGRRKPPRIACCPLRAFASRGCAREVEESRRESSVAHSALARLADARERLKKAAANRALPTSRWRVSRTRARGRRKPPRIARCPLRAGASRGCARGTEGKRGESRVARSALSRLTDAHEVLKNAPRIMRCPFRAFASHRCARSAEECAANHALPVPRFRISRTRARG